ncbi:CU044_5270 family protein [Streptomyces sp. NPDC049040]|uniref:CU044_5270 family protein n=1 Tax=Streptomyces sp. NPDC049040 TaxID=3365593 RepID=UPI003712F55B
MRDIEELRVLREYDAGAPPLDAATRRRVWLRLSAAMEAEGRPAPAVRRRPVLRIALTGVVAAAVAGGVLIAGQGGDGGQTATPRETGSPVLLNVSAQTVLDGAAAYARQHEQAAHPRDDQFLYTKEIIKETNQKTGATKSYTDEDWRSVDDSKRSWVMEVGKGWWSEPLENGETQWPPQDWTTLKKLPTDPKRLILSLAPGSDPATPTPWATPPASGTPSSTGATALPGNGDASLSGISDMGWSMLHFQLVGLLKLVPVMPDGLRPAAYEALGMIPGVKVAPNQKDAKGRIGVAISYDDPTLPAGVTNSDDAFIFDPQTYEFLGFRTKHFSGHGKDRAEIDQLSSLDSWAVVDKAKQRP